MSGRWSEDVGIKEEIILHRNQFREAVRKFKKVLYQEQQDPCVRKVDKLVETDSGEELEVG